MPDATLCTYNGCTLHVTEDKTILCDKKGNEIRTWLHENVKWKPNEPGFMDYMKSKAELWMIANFIETVPAYHIEDYETAWPIMDQDGEMLLCPNELTETEQRSQATLDAMARQPRTIGLTIKQATDPNGTSFLYHEMYMTLTDPDKNLTIGELKDNMMRAVNTYFAPHLDTGNWPELVKYVPPCVTDLFGFSVTNEPKEYSMKI